MRVLPLCDIHHRNGSHKRPISRHPQQEKDFEEAYGTEEELLEQVENLLKEPRELP